MWQIVFGVPAYFIGNINPAIIIGKLYGVDVRSEGSGNAGTTNALRTIGKKAGALTFVIDVLKGWVPLLAIEYIWGIDGGPAFAFLCGIFIILGHMYPIVFGFKGGKGVATTFGVLLFADWRLALILIGIVLALAAATRIVSLSVLVACAAAIPLAYFMAGTNYCIIIAIIVALVVFKHRANIGRLIRREEPKLSFGSKG
jgi:glycerol-3-phosphate acyltransferase PlsY